MIHEYILLFQFLFSFFLMADLKIFRLCNVIQQIKVWPNVNVWSSSECRAADAPVPNLHPVRPCFLLPPWMDRDCAWEGKGRGREPGTGGGEGGEPGARGGVGR